MAKQTAYDLVTSCQEKAQNTTTQQERVEHDLPLHLQRHYDGADDVVGVDVGVSAISQGIALNEHKQHHFKSTRQQP